MGKIRSRIGLGLALALALSTGSLVSPQTRRVQVLAPACRHDAGATQADRERRDQARALARAINAAEAQLARQTRQYHPLGALKNLPAPPRGFELNLFAESSGYIFSIKDTLDPCRYAIFSDQAGFLYEKSALPAPLVAPGS